MNASGNNIATLGEELLSLYSLETLYLVGNPVVNQHSYLAKIENNPASIKKSLESYFGGGSGGGISPGIKGIGMSTGSNLGSSFTSNISTGGMGTEIHTLGQVGKSDSMPIGGY